MKEKFKDLEVILSCGKCTKGYYKSDVYKGVSKVSEDEGYTYVFICKKCFQEIKG